MITKIFKIFVFFAFTLVYSQSNTALNIVIDGMHCAGGCAKMIENSLNQNQGITAVVDFQKSAASIIYDADLYSENNILSMINGYRDGKFKASLNSAQKQCSKGKKCCQKTGSINANCDNKSKVNFLSITRSINATCT